MLRQHVLNIFYVMPKQVVGKFLNDGYSPTSGCKNCFNRAHRFSGLADQECNVAHFRDGRKKLKIICQTTLVFEQRFVHCRGCCRYDILFLHFCFKQRYYFFLLFISNRYRYYNLLVHNNNEGCKNL